MQPEVGRQIFMERQAPPTSAFAEFLGIGQIHSSWRASLFSVYQCYKQGPVSINITITKIKQKPKATKEGVKRQEETMKRELEKSRERKKNLRY